MKDDHTLTMPSGMKPAESANDVDSTWGRLTRRRKFLQGLGAIAAGAALPTAKLFAANDKKLTKGDAALLQAALMIEQMEADLGDNLLHAPSFVVGWQHGQQALSPSLL